MALKPQQRWMAILGALVLTLSAVAWVQQQETEDSTIAVVTPHAKKDRQQDEAASELTLPSAKTTQLTGALPDLSQRAQTLSANDALDVDLFKSHAWYVPPPPKPVIEVVEVAKPSAPPIPFTYFGRMDNGPQGNLIFLSSRDKLRTVKIGQVIDGAWRLDKADATSLQFTYMPLSMPVTLMKSAKMMPAAAAPILQDAQDQPRDF